MSAAMQAESRPQSPEQTLRALGVQCTVERHGNLALVIPAPGDRALENAAVRRAVLAALRSYGFTHAAVEPGDERASAQSPDASIA